ncbi:osmoprotectant ABC transporter permease protein YehY [Klebsiella variicola]|uniref:Osmoprotectant ABC transporter permease protein YehY n=1 Tax=Klebsiella variicola TaxID=244366 RepID=A0A7H4MNW9_KLEVA|nr:osmoprotectant ABC transporter permease protein YehY [Klebsiella variicola]
MTIRCTHRVGLLLTGLLLVTLALPFITYAPNRLLSGEGRGLWQVMPWLAGVQLAAVLAGMLLCWLPGRAAPLLHLLLAELLFPLLIWGSGQAALELSRHGSPLARTSPGSACGCRWRFVCCWPARPSVILPSGRCGAGCLMRKSGCCPSSCLLPGRSISSLC